MTLTDRPIVLVNAGAYAGQELQAEFGALPPTFLPVGMDRLYELQAQMLAPLQAQLVMTLPDSFDLPPWDAARLAELGFTVIRSAETLGLGAALLYALGRLGFHDRPLRILHGDTLIWDLDLHQDNAAAVTEGGDGYRWAQVDVDAAGTIARIDPPGIEAAPTTVTQLCGYFAFLSAARFAEHLVLAEGDFYGALNRETADTGLQALQATRWLDFGHVQTFFRSRRTVTTERAFNTLSIGDMHVRKRSATATPKLRAEARWLREIPAPLAPFCARLLGEGEDGQGYYYDSQYEYMPTLAELYVFARVTPPSWIHILGSCAAFIDTAARQPPCPATGGSLRRLAVDKAAARLEAFAPGFGIDLDAPNRLNGAPAPSLRQCLADVESALATSPDAPAVMHGDFCFSNILYSFRTERICLIDPRALTGSGEFSLHGDTRYDLAKLMHSIAGHYDLILAGRYQGARTGPQSFELAFPQDPWRTRTEAAARDMVMGGIRLGAPDVWAAMVSLFLSMPPLHADRPDRQAAFIANALRLHHDMDRAR